MTALGTSNFIEENGLEGKFVVAGPDNSSDSLSRALKGSYAGIITIDWAKELDKFFDVAQPGAILMD